MGHMNSGWCRLVLAAAALGVSCGGCAWYEEMVEQQDLRLHAAPTRPAAPVYSPAPAPALAATPAPVLVAQAPVAQPSSQETATLRVALNTAQDSNRRLLARVGELEDTLAIRNREAEDLRKQVAELETQLKTSNDEWQRRLAELRASMDTQHKEALDAMAAKMAQEMAQALKAREQARKTAVATVHTVSQGEVLSVIAAAYRVSLKDLKEINGLKSDVIRVGQKLKIPAAAN